MHVADDATRLIESGLKESDQPHSFSAIQEVNWHRNSYLAEVQVVSSIPNGTRVVID